jgi:hypothetical protein
MSVSSCSELTAFTFIYDVASQISRAYGNCQHLIYSFGAIVLIFECSIVSYRTSLSLFGMTRTSFRSRLRTVNNAVDSAVNSAVNSAVKKHYLWAFKNPRRAIPRHIPGHFKSVDEERAEYLQNRSWDSPDFVACHGSSHLVHKEDFQPYCGTCANPAIPLSEGETVMNANDLLQTLSFSCCNAEYKPDAKISLRQLEQKTGIPGNPVLIPGGSIIMVKRFNELLGNFPYKQVSEEFAELKIRGGSLRQIYKSIMDYYHPKPQETRGFDRFRDLKVDGIIKRGDLYDCKLCYNLE